MEKPVPVEIRHMKENGIVRITWNDGHAGDYPRKYLRGYCPCALCQGHDATPVRFVEATETEISEISAVGNYAIQFSWSDGHSTGIYTFDHLRSLCPCPQCKEEKEE